MAASATPYGLLPVKLLSGTPHPGAMRQIKIASGYGTSIFHGDLVGLSSGTIVKDTGTTSANPIGVFVGCEYVNSFGYLIHSQYFPASTTAPTGTAIWAYVVDDPFTLFQVQANGSLAETTIGKNLALVQGSGSTTTGKSGVTVDASSAATTNTLPVRIVDFVRSELSEPGDAYTDVIVRFNTHRHLNATGV